MDRLAELRDRPWAGYSAGAGPLLAICCAALLAVGIGLRLWRLDQTPGLNADEAWYGVWAIQASAGTVPTWQTPTGNPINLLFAGPLTLLHKLFAPSITLLRSVAVASGLLALVVNWLLCCRALDRTTAATSTIILAVLPLNIAYSRFAWDASQSVLVTLPVWYFALGAARATCRRPLWIAAALLALVLAAWVHPTNLLASVAILSALCARPAGPNSQYQETSAAARKKTGRDSTRGSQANTILALAALAIVGFGLAWTLTAPEAWFGRLQSSFLAERLRGVGALLTPGGLATTLALMAHLFMGQTIYSYIAGSQSWLDWPGNGAVLSLDVIAFWGIVGWSVFRLQSAVYRNQPANQFLPRTLLRACPLTLSQTTGVAPGPADRALLWGWALAMLGFVLTVGPPGLQPGYERYAIGLIAPTALLVGRAIALSLAGSRRGSCIGLMGVALACLLLADFHAHYFLHIAKTGGTAHRAFRTSAIEPKLQAANLLSLGDRTTSLVVVADDYWLHWPLRYFLAPAPQARVVSSETLESESREGGARQAVWIAEFVRSGEYDPTGGDASRVILDAAGRPLIRVRPQNLGISSPAWRRSAVE
ncbi:MAG: hypothetical protein ACOY3P_21180 [Planctomycetota bacterium]